MKSQLIALILILVACAWLGRPAPRSLTGLWTWDTGGHYHGTLKLEQQGDRLRGHFHDDVNGSEGEVEGTVKGRKVSFVRRLSPNCSQDYRLDGDAERLDGTLSGFYDANYPADFHARRAPAF